VQEAALLHADVDERGLHAGENGGHESLVDVPDVALLLLAIDEQLAELIVLEDGHTRFLGIDVDEDLALHGSLVDRGGSAVDLAEKISVLAESLEEGQCMANFLWASVPVQVPRGASPQPAT
jgi:hypothetical protein